METVNAPAEKIAQALFNDPRNDDLKMDGGCPADCLLFIDSLLSLKGCSETMYRQLLG